MYAEGTVISVRARMEKLQRIVEADPSELVAIAGSACRYCWSGNGGYQFRDDAEMGRAVDRYMRSLGGPKPQQPPDTSGGIGYKGDREPNEFCKQCEGAGLTHTVITPTAHLSQAGKALYKGARQKANGEIEVMMHDQLVAADMLNKLQSAYVERSVNINANVSVPSTVDLSTPEALLASFNALGNGK